MKVLIKSIDNDWLGLDNSPFREPSGGQPCDYGTLISDDFEAVVYDVKGNKVKVKVTKGVPKVNTEVIATIDMERRQKLTRMHTAEHIFFKSLQTVVPSVKLDKISLDVEESSVFVFSENLTWEELIQAETKVREIINQDLNIIEHIVAKSKVNQAFPQLRIKLERVKEDKVRVIEVKAFDYSACSGTHCLSTKEVKGFLVTKFNSSGKGKYEIKFKVDVIDDLYNFASILRKSSSILEVEYEKFESTLKNLKINLEKYKTIARNAKPEYVTETINNVQFKHGLAETETKSLMKFMQELLTPDSVVCFINKTDKNNIILLSIGNNVNLNAKDTLDKVYKEFNGKGGGKDKFAQGSIFTDDFEKVFGYIKDMIK
ncbi:hypothetical protein D6777_02680 [Candidatus Woesearchaeota archaeon]|nr:MAG: hypothetical protein D6777_02680 [Candidatus Woesearchaeota archaeon]